MNRYPTEVVATRKLLRRAVRLHYLTLKHTIFFLLLITATKYAAVLLIDLVPNLYLDIVIEIIAAVFVVFFFSAALLSTHRSFIDKPFQSNKESLKIIWQEKQKIYATFFIYAIGVVAAYYVAQCIVLLGDKLLHATSPMEHPYVLMIGFVVFAMYVLMFYFSFPLSIIEKKSIPILFRDSVLLGEKNKFGVVFLCCMFAAVILLLTPGMIHEYLLSTYHLDALFDFIVLCVAAPIYFNFLLFMMSDAKVQRRSRL